MLRHTGNFGFSPREGQYLLTLLNLITKLDILHIVVQNTMGHGPPLNITHPSRCSTQREKSVTTTVFRLHESKSFSHLNVYQNIYMTILKVKKSNRNSTRRNHRVDFTHLVDRPFQYTSVSVTNRKRVCKHDNKNVFLFSFVCRTLRGSVVG